MVSIWNQAASKRVLAVGNHLVTYANWCDESIPALDNKTPRQAIQSAAGMERVKGLLRSYEFSEKEQARQQGRTEVSFDFLWAAIGLSR